MAAFDAHAQLTFFARLNPIPVSAVNADVARAARTCVERTQGPASGNRIMAVFRQVPRACVKWEWLTHAPLVPMAYIEEHEIEPATWLDIERLLEEVPPHTRAPALFTLLQGPRMANVRDLEWTRVDLARRHAWIPSSHYKGKRAHGMALAAPIVTLLQSLPREGRYVFTYRGKKIAGTFNTRAFREARKRAGLAHFRWHDLRHAAASFLATKGASDRVLQAVMGWADPRMAYRYSHLRSEELRPWADAVGTFAGTALEIAMAPKVEKPKGNMVPGRGLEPPTRALRMRCSTN